MTCKHNLKKMSISLSAAMLGATILALNNNKTVKADTTDNDHLETDSNGQNDPVVQAKRQEFNPDRTKNESIAGELTKVMSDDESSSNHSSLPKQEFNQDRTKTRVKINKKYLTKNEQTRPKSYLGNEKKRAEYAKTDDLLKSELTNKDSSANESLINSNLVNNNALFNLQTNDQNNADNIQLSRQNNDNKNTISAQEDGNKSTAITNFGTINLADYQALDLNSFNLSKNSINLNTTIKMLNENKVQISDDELKRKANYWGRTNGQITQDDLNFLNNNVGQNGHKFYLSSIGYTSEAEGTPKAKESHTEIIGDIKPQNNRIDTAVRNSFSGDLHDEFKHTFTIDKDTYNQNIGGHILISDIIQFDNVDSQYGSYFMNAYVLNNNNEIRDQYHNIVGYLGISMNYSPKGIIREDKLWLNIPSSAQKVGTDITSTFAGDYFNDDSYSWANVFNHTSKAPDGKWQTELLLDKDHVNFIGKTRDVNQDVQPYYVENSSNNNTAPSVNYKVFSLGFNHQENINHTQVERSHQVIKLEALGLDEKDNTKLVDLPITRFSPSIQTFDALDAGNNQQIIMFRKDIGLDRVYLPDNLTSNEVYEAATQNKNKIVISKQSDNSLLVGYDLSTDCVKQDKQQLLYDLKCSYYLNYQHPELKDEITNRTIQAYENRNWNVTTFNTQAFFVTDNNQFRAIRETLLTPGQEINSNTYYGNSNTADSKTQYNAVIPVRYVDDDTGQTINNSVINAVSGSTVSINPLLDITPLPNYVFNNINAIDYGLVKPKDNNEIVIHVKQKIFNTTPISYDSGSLSSPTRKVVGNENSDLDNLLNRYRSDPNVMIIQDPDVFYHPNDDDQNNVVNAFKKANTDNFNQYNNIVQQIKDWQKKQADYNKDRQNYIDDLKKRGLWNDDSVDPTTIKQNFHLDLNANNNSIRPVLEALSDKITIVPNGDGLNFKTNDAIPGSFVKATYNGITNSYYRNHKISKMVITLSNIGKNAKAAGSYISFVNGINNGYWYKATGVDADISFFDENDKPIVFDKSDSYISFSSLNPNTEDRTETVKLRDGMQYVPLNGSFIENHANGYLYGTQNYPHPWALDWDSSTSNNRIQCSASAKFSGDTIKIRSAWLMDARTQDNLQTMPYGASWFIWSTLVPQMSFDAQSPKLEIHYHHNIVRPEIKRDYHVDEIMPQAKYGHDKTIIGVKAALKRDASMNMATGRIMNGYFGLDHGSNNSYNPNSGIDHDEYSWYGNNVQLNPQDSTKASVIADSIPGYHSYEMSTGSGTSFNPDNDPWHTWGKFMNVDFNRATNRVTMNMFKGLEPNSAIGQENYQIMYTPSYTSRTIYFVDTDAEQNHENASDVRKGNSSDQNSKEITDTNHIILNKSIGTTGTVDTTSEFDLTGNIIYQTLYSEGYRLVDSPKFTIDYNNWQDKDGNWHVQTGPIYVRLKHGTQDVTETDPYTKFQMKNVVKYHEQGYSLANPNDQVNHENTLTIGLTRKATKDLVTGDVFYGKWTIDQSNAKNAYDTETLLKGYIPIDGNSRRGYATYITQNSRDGDDQINKQNAYHNLVRSGHLAIGVVPNIRLVNSDKKGYDFAPGITNNDLNKDVYIYANNHDAFSNQIDVYYVPWKRHLKANIYAGDKNVLLNDHPDLSGVSFTGDTIRIDWSKLKPEYRQSAHDLPQKYTFDVPDEGGAGDYYKQLHDLDPDDNYDPYINDENPDKALEHGNDYLPIYIDGVYKKLPDEKRTITRIIQVNDNGKMQEVKHDQVEISRSVVQEMLLGKKIYGDWTSGKFERYAIPQRDGYYSVIERDGNTDETKTINELEVDEDSPVQIVYTIDYVKDQAQQQVNFVTKQGVRIADETIEGSLGDKKDVDQTVIPEGWKLISSPTVVISNGISNLIVVHDPYKVPHDDYVAPNTPIVGNLVYPNGLDEKDLNQTVTRTINLHYPTGEVKSIVQEIEFTRTGYFNPNTGQVYYDGWESENNVFEKYDVPSVDGYTPSQSEVAAKEIASPIANETVDIYYSAGNRTILINYRDNSDSGNDTKTSHREEYEGDVDTVKKINIDLSNGEELDHLGVGYSFVYNNGQYLIKANKDITDSDHVLSLNNMRTLRGQKHFILEYTFSEVNLPFEIFTNHTTQEVTAKDSEYANLHKTVSRNIYVYQPDGTLLPPITESVSFVRTAVKDMSTGKVRYTPWKLEKDKTKSLGVIKGFKANNIDGYDTLNPANNNDITVDPNNDVNTDLKDVVISYAPKMQKSAIIFVQKGSNKYDSSRNVEINGQTYEIIGGRTFTGRTDEIVSLKEYQHDYTIPVGYKAVNVTRSGLWNHIPDSYKFKADGNKPIYIEVVKDKL